MASFVKDLFLTKSFAVLRQDANASAMRRTLTAKDVILIGVGDIIGAGIFVITGKAAALYAGPAIVLSFVISGIACVFAGLAYSEMAALVPISGSAYTYTYATMGEVLAFIIGWDLCLEYLAGAASVAVGWSAYLISFAKYLGAEIPNTLVSAPVAYHSDKGFFVDDSCGVINLPAFLVVIALTVVLCVGIKQSAFVNHLFVGIKLVVILMFLFATFGSINPDNWSPFIPEPHNGHSYGFSGVLRASTLVFFAYIGFDAVSTCAQEVKRPARDMPIGILGSLGVCTVLYILVSLNLTGIAHYETLNSAAPLADAVKNLGMGWLKIAVSVGGISGLTSVMLVSLMAQARVFSAMAADGLLPASLGKIHPRFGTPLVPTIISGVTCAFASAFLPLDVLGDMTSAGTLFAFTLVSISVGVLRFTQPELERPFKVPGGPILVPFLGAACAITLIVTTGWSTVLRLVIWMAIGLVVYGGYGYRHSRLRNGRGIPLDDKSGVELSQTALVEEKGHEHAS
ncbi:hypothetical protein AMAG_10313 [Allomyces macrogynus ATCC 38327]|uniref:Amino acid transporter n=1 Tax=Allomyces macrogynus (strain ATCC 38327) TaxID=578462 RepID=A0A0L0SUN8_ALLM3|nr:hypothetical protein AMAG_10313 [Allomyces macrogynus ATCC 38327]|eukprot:KNE66044.1 hypothetical protein AMAG_10313 [Allomyces macrogynus ATCC 38327]